MKEAIAAAVAVQLENQVMVEKVKRILQVARVKMILMENIKSFRRKHICDFVIAVCGR